MAAIESNEAADEKLSKEPRQRATFARAYSPTGRLQVTFDTESALHCCHYADLGLRQPSARDRAKENFSLNSIRFIRCTAAATEDDLFSRSDGATCVGQVLV